MQGDAAAIGKPCGLNIFEVLRSLVVSEPVLLDDKEATDLEDGEDMSIQGIRVVDNDLGYE
jgi:hypothetical protein